MAGMNWERAAKRDRVSRYGADPVSADLGPRKARARKPACQHEWGPWRKPQFARIATRSCEKCNRKQTRTSTATASPPKKRVVRTRIGRVAATKGDLIVRAPGRPTLRVPAEDAAREARLVVATPETAGRTPASATYRAIRVPIGKGARNLAAARALGISVDELKRRRREEAAAQPALRARAAAMGISVKQLKRRRSGK